MNTEDAVGLLDHFGLRENGVLLNGAAVLFGNDKFVRYSNLEVKMGWFRGTTDREFLDNRHVCGNIFKLMDEAMAFCFKHLNLSAKIGGKLERDEALEVPAAALREALVNAFAHREYGDTRTVYLAVYADRVEIKSPGGFPTSLDLERLYDPPVCDSNPRNPRIARVLYLCKMIETWGRGLGVIARECARAGLPLPVTTVRWGFAVTTFKRPKIDASGSNLDQNLDRADPDPIQIDSHPEGDLARRLLSTIRRNPLISRKLLAIELSVSERKIRDSLKILKNSGLIARQGPDHGGIWRISRRVAPAQGESAPAQGGNAPVREENAPAQSTGKQIPNALEERIGKLGRHVKSEILQGVIVELCKVRPMSKDDLIQILGRKERTIKKLVTPLLGKELDYLYPMMIHHPRQAYVASGKRKGTE